MVEDLLKQEVLVDQETLPQQVHHKEIQVVRAQMLRLIFEAVLVVEQQQ